MEKEQLKAYAERLKWYIQKVKETEKEGGITTWQTDVAIQSLIGYLEGFISFID